MSGARGIFERGKKYIQDFSREKLKEDTISKP
jgi:hypothetical protein